MVKIERKKDYKRYDEFIVISGKKFKVRISLGYLFFVSALLFTGLIVLSSIFVGNNYLELNAKFWSAIVMFSMMGLASLIGIFVWIFRRFIVFSKVVEESVDHGVKRMDIEVDFKEVVKEVDKIGREEES